MVQSTRSPNVVTKVGKHFLSLLDKHFSPHNYKIFNRNSGKISSSCKPNMKIFINSHNQEITYARPSLNKESATA